MTLRPPRAFLLLAAVLLGSTGAFSFGAGILATVQNQPAPGAVLGLFGLVLWTLMVSSWRMALIADPNVVVRSWLWPKRVRRDELRSIKFVAARPPVWVFVRNDGTMAFNVSAYLFSREDLAKMADLLGSRVEAPPDLKLKG